MIYQRPGLISVSLDFGFTLKENVQWVQKYFEQNSWSNLSCLSSARRRLMPNTWWDPLDSLGRAEWSQDLGQLCFLSQAVRPTVPVFQAFSCYKTLLLCLGIISKSSSSEFASLQAWSETSIGLLWILPAIHLKALLINEFTFLFLKQFYLFYLIW